MSSFEKTSWPTMASRSHMAGCHGQSGNNSKLLISPLSLGFPPRLSNVLKETAGTSTQLNEAIRVAEDLERKGGKDATPAKILKALQKDHPQLYRTVLRAFEAEGARQKALVERLFGPEFLGDMPKSTLAYVPATGLPKMGPDGKPRLEPKLQRAIMIANWIDRRSNSRSWSASDLPRVEALIREKSQPGSAKARQLRMATQSEQILRGLESGRYDDAMAVGLGLQAVVNENLTNGVMDKAGLTEDLKMFFIDHAPRDEFGHSPVAASFFGGSRVGSSGWQTTLTDQKPGGKKVNQAHHMAAFLVKGLKDNWATTTFMARANELFDGHVGASIVGSPDVTLGELSANLAREAKNGRIAWDQFPTRFYEAISGKSQASLQQEFARVQGYASVSRR